MEDEEVQIFVVMPGDVTFTHTTRLSAKVRAFVPRGFALCSKKYILPEDASLRECGVSSEATLVARRLQSEVCPLTLSPFVNPVFTSYGQTYEREALLQWLEKKSEDPCTRQELTLRDLHPEHCASPRYGFLEGRFFLPNHGKSQFKVRILVNWHDTIASVKQAFAVKIVSEAEIPKDDHFVTLSMANIKCIVHAAHVFEATHDAQTLLGAAILPDSVCFLVFQ